MDFVESKTKYKHGYLEKASVTLWLLIFSIANLFTVDACLLGCFVVVGFSFGGGGLSFMHKHW